MSLPTIHVGQVWEDCDWRVKGRRLVVLEEPNLDVPNPAEAPVLVRNVETGKRTSIRLRRFRPGSTGYRLVEEAR